MFLEVGVACLQAYVFTILTCIYLNDAIHLPKVLWISTFRFVWGVVLTNRILKLLI